MVKKIKKIKKVKKVKKKKRVIVKKKNYWGGSREGGTQQYITDEKQCMWRDEDGERCGKFRVEPDIYCEHHGGVVYKDTPWIDFNLLKWIKENEFQQDEEGYSLDEYPHMIQIYQDKHPNKRIMKAAQVGITHFGVIFSLAFLETHNGRKVIYTLPTRTEASRISKERVDALCTENSDIFYGGNGDSSKEKSKYDSVMEKQFGRSFLFLQGTWSRKQAMSTPADLLIHDELDECKGDVVTMFRSRIGNSDYKWKVVFSTPTYADNPIHKAFLESDQHHWWYKCEHCEHVFMLCCSFPEVIQLNEETNEYYFGCVKCKKEIKRDKGWWKAENPSSKYRGYHVTKLIAPRVSANDIMNAKNDYKFERDFFNFELGQPYAGEEDRLVRADLEGCEDGRYTLIYSGELNTCMGVDQGGEDLYVLILKPMHNKLRLIYVDHIIGMNCWRELYTLMTQFKVVRCVVDAMPDTFKAREFQQDWKTKVFLCYYNKKRKEMIDWQPNKGMVLADRSLTLDLMCQNIKDVKKRKYIFPISDKLVPVYFHILALIRQKIEGADGESHYEYKKVRNDHFAHALNYATIASENLTMDSFNIFVTKEREEDKTKIIGLGKHSDEILNRLAIYILTEKISFETLINYRCNRVNGKLVENMTNLNDLERKIMFKLEMKYTVKDMIVTLSNIQFCRDRVNMLIERRIEKQMSSLLGKEEIVT